MYYIIMNIKVNIFGKTIIEFSHYFMIDDKLDLKIVYETVQINYNLIEMT